VSQSEVDTELEVSSAEKAAPEAPEKLVEGIFADLGAGSGLCKSPARQTAAHSERATLDANLGSMFNAD
jgi:hypothetical protein